MPAMLNRGACAHQDMVDLIPIAQENSFVAKRITKGDAICHLNADIIDAPAFPLRASIPCTAWAALVHG